MEQIFINYVITPLVPLLEFQPEKEETFFMPIQNQ